MDNNPCPLSFRKYKCINFNQALIADHLDCAIYFFYDDYNNILYRACYCCSINIITYLLENKLCNINYQDEYQDKNTILHHICVWNHIDDDFLVCIIELLLKHGADPDLMNNNSLIFLDLYKNNKNYQQHVYDELLVLHNRYTSPEIKDPGYD